MTREITPYPPILPRAWWVQTSYRLPSGRWMIVQRYGRVRVYEMREKYFGSV